MSNCFCFSSYGFGMQCKLCEFDHSSREVLLKHYRLRHYQGRSWQHPCLYTDCVCTYKIVGALKTHLTRSYKHTAAVTDHFNFSCELCDFKDVCQPSQFLNHIRNHLRRHDTVNYPFKDCELTTNVLSTFSSHVSKSLSITFVCAEGKNCKNMYIGRTAEDCSS